MSKLGAFMSAVPSGSAAAAAPASTTSPDFTPAAAAQPAPEPVTPEDTKVVPESEPPAIVVEEVQGKMDTDTSKEESAAPAAAAGEEEVTPAPVSVEKEDSEAASAATSAAAPTDAATNDDEDGNADVSPQETVAPAAVVETAAVEAAPVEAAPVETAPAAVEPTPDAAAVAVATEPVPDEVSSTAAAAVAAEAEPTPPPAPNVVEPPPAAEPPAPEPAPALAAPVAPVPEPAPEPAPVTAAPAPAAAAPAPVAAPEPAAQPAAPAAAAAAPAAPAEDEDERRRSSVLGGDVLKYKHLYGAPNKKADTYYNLTPAVNIQMEAQLLAADARFWAVPWSGGGGPVHVHQHGAFGKVADPSSAFVVNGHKSPAVALAFSPMDLPNGGSLLATGSDDQTIKLWQVPSGGLTRSLTESDAQYELKGHYGGVRALEFHPTAPVMASAAASTEIAFWDLEKGTKLAGGGFSHGLGSGSSGGASDDFEDQESAGICNLSFNYQGSLLAVATKKSSAKIYDPRAPAGANVVAEVGSGGSSGGSGSSGGMDVTRGQRVVWCTNFGGAGECLLTVGSASGGRGRRLCMWDPRNLGAGPTLFKKIDAGSGQLFPLYDEGSGTLLLSGRGDTTARVFELGPSCDKLSHCGDVTLPGAPPLCGWAKLPTSCGDVANVEVARVLRLTNTSVDPISFILPRSDTLKQYFQDDVFPPARSRVGPYPQSVVEWAEEGKNANPARVSLAPEGMPLLSNKPPEVKRVSNAQVLQAKVNAEAAEKDQTDAMMARLQGLAKQRASYHPNNSMGARKGVDAAPIHDSDDSDAGWSDDD